MCTRRSGEDCLLTTLFVNVAFGRFLDGFQYAQHGQSVVRFDLGHSIVQIVRLGSALLGDDRFVAIDVARDRFASRTSRRRVHFGIRFVFENDTAIRTVAFDEEAGQIDVILILVVVLGFVGLLVVGRFVIDGEFGGVANTLLATTAFAIARFRIFRRIGTIQGAEVFREVTPTTTRFAHRSLVGLAVQGQNGARLSVRTLGIAHVCVLVDSAQILEQRTHIGDGRIFHFLGERCLALLGCIGQVGQVDILQSQADETSRILDHGLGQ